jgi:hypothetical protein
MGAAHAETLVAEAAQVVLTDHRSDEMSEEKDGFEACAERSRSGRRPAVMHR